MPDQYGNPINLDGISEQPEDNEEVVPEELSDFLSFGVKEPAPLPLFTMDNVWHLYEESMADELQAGLIALALREDVNEVLEQPWSFWNKEEQSWEPTMYSKHFVEVFRQMNDKGEMVRNEFTGLATLKLKYPLHDPDLTEIAFITIPTVSIVSEQALYTGDHELAHSLRMLSKITGKPMDLFRQLYIGDYTALREEADNLMPTPSRS